MAGMYPDNETLKIFGETVSWPGVDENGKFTNGSFSDPAVRPSFIPAQTINLIVDNISELLVALDKEPNNEDPDQLALALTEALDEKAPLNKLHATGGHKHTGGTDDAPQIETAGIALKAVTTAKIEDITADTASAKAAFSTSAVTFQNFLQTVWQGIAWLNSKLHATSGHKHTGGADDAPQIETAGIASNAVTTAKIANVTPDTTSTKASFSTAALTFATFIQTVWRGITWLNAKLNASSGHKHTGGTDDAPRIDVRNLDYPVGWRYDQGPNDPTPAEAGLLGTWELWYDRVEIYGLSTSLPSYTIYEAGQTYAANAYYCTRIPTLPTSKKFSRQRKQLQTPQRF